MKNIKDFDNFCEDDGFLIIYGIDESKPGGKVVLGSGGLTIYPADTEDEGSYSELIINTDDTTIKNHDGVLAVENPLPDPTEQEAEDGYVLTYSDTDGIVWAAPQGGGADIPDYSNLNYDQSQDSGSGLPYKLVCRVTKDSDTGVISRALEWLL